MYPFLIRNKEEELSPSSSGSAEGAIQFQFVLEIWSIWCPKSLVSPLDEDEGIERKRMGGKATLRTHRRIPRLKFNMDTMSTPKYAPPIAVIS